MQGGGHAHGTLVLQWPYNAADQANSGIPKGLKSWEIKKYAWNPNPPNGLWLLSREVPLTIYNYYPKNFSRI